MPLHSVVSLCVLFFLLCASPGCDSVDGLPNVPHRVVSVDEDHDEMNAAMSMAKETFESFIRHWNAPGIESCSLKFAMDSDAGRVEHTWFTPIRIEGDLITARCANDPKNIASLHYGDVRTLDRKSVSDWMIMSDGKCYGGYTIRVLAKIDPTSVPTLQFADYTENEKK